MAHINRQLKNIFLILIIFSASVSVKVIFGSKNVEINPAGKG